MGVIPAHTSASMTTLLERFRPTIVLCTAFGLGLPYADTKKASLQYWLLLVANVAMTSFTTLNALSRSHQIKLEPMVVITIVNFLVRISAPLFSMISMCLNRNAVRRAILSLDDLLPFAEHTSLAPYAWHFYRWILLSVIVNYANLIAVSVSNDDFQTYSVANVVVAFLHNTWHSIPIAQYAVAISLIRHGVRDINGDVTTVSEWKSRRLRWKRLKNTAEYLTESVFGVVIILFMWTSVGDALFYFWVCHQSVKANMVFRSCVFMATSVSRLGFVLSLFCTCNSCKKEITKTIMVLNDVKTSSISDLKAVEYASLYILHTDFKLKPCDIFELSFNKLLTIFTVLAAFLTFQIQMTLLYSEDVVFIDF